MKVALLTFHNAANYGAALQAYALQRKLDLHGVDNEYINYQNAHRVNSYSISHHIITALKKGDLKGALRYFLGFPFLNLRKLRFISFYKKNLRSTQSVYRSSTEAQALNDHFDKFIVGSDQVWNWRNNGSDHAYLLSFVSNNEKKISYSSSFGIAEIPEDLKSVYEKYLSTFQHLAVREKHGGELVFDLIGRKPVLVLDPVFLLSKEDWMEVADPKKETDSFIFSYTNKPNQLENFIKTTNYDMSSKLIYKLSRNLAISDFLSSKIKVKYSMSPQKFLSYVRDAELVVSASFHCVALTIVMNKPFVAILTGNKGKDERLLNILTLLNLESRIYHSDMTSEDINASIDYTTVNKKIDELKNSSMEYLMNAINEG